MKKTAKADKELLKLTEDLQRAQADLVNYRNRVEREKAELLDFAKGQVISELLPLLDNLERALAHLPKELTQNDWAKGVVSVSKQVQEALKKMGVERIGTVGKAFDPHLHEAVSAEGDGEVETVTEELQAGYKLGQEVLRPAIVKVRRK